jgi:hypothetical protein
VASEFSGFRVSIAVFSCCVFQSDNSLSMVAGLVSRSTVDLRIRDYCWCYATTTNRKFGVCECRGQLEYVIQQQMNVNIMFYHILFTDVFRSLLRPSSWCYTVTQTRIQTNCLHDCIGCPTRYLTRHFFNNSNTNEDIATKFKQGYFRCVRNEEECVCSAPNCCDTVKLLQKCRVR